MRDGCTHTNDWPHICARYGPHPRRSSPILGPLGKRYRVVRPALTQHRVVVGRLPRPPRYRRVGVVKAGMTPDLDQALSNAFAGFVQWVEENWTVADGEKIHLRDALKMYLETCRMPDADWPENSE